MAVGILVEVGHGELTKSPIDRIAVAKRAAIALRDCAPGTATAEQRDYMDIGTAKPDALVRSRVTHHLVDLIDPDQTYSAARFRTDALSAMAEIRSRGRIPLLVGGTMLYFKALREGLSRLPQADAQLRKELDDRAAAAGWPALHAELARVDPATAARLKTTDSQRIQRALEVYRISGKPLSVLQGAREPGGAPDFLAISLLAPDRAELHRRIAERFDAMPSVGNPTPA